MLRLFYTPKFVRQYGKLPEDLKREVKEKLVVFVKEPEHPSLRTHKLSGKFSGCFSFSVNYRYRIIFEYDAENTVALLAVGDHDVYR